MSNKYHDVNYWIKEIEGKRVLNLFGNNIGSEECKYLSESLKNNISLQQLDLGDNNIRDEGCKYLSESLKNNTSLQQLILGNNNIGDEGCKYLSESLKNNTSLQRLILWNNKIGNEGIRDLEEALKENISLIVLNWGYENTLEIEKELKRNKNLKQHYQKQIENFENNEIVQYLLRELDLRKNILGFFLKSYKQLNFPNDLFYISSFGGCILSLEYLFLKENLNFDINSLDENGKTCLEYAFLSERITTINFLLWKGAKKELIKNPSKKIQDLIDTIEKDNEKEFQLERNLWNAKFSKVDKFKHQFLLKEIEIERGIYNRKQEPILKLSRKGERDLDLNESRNNNKENLNKKIQELLNLELKEKEKLNKTKNSCEKIIEELSKSLNEYEKAKNTQSSYFFGFNLFQRKENEENEINVTKFEANNFLREYERIKKEIEEFFFECEKGKKEQEKFKEYDWKKVEDKMKENINIKEFIFKIRVELIDLDREVQILKLKPKLNSNQIEKVKEEIIQIRKKLNPQENKYSKNLSFLQEAIDYFPEIIIEIEEFQDPQFLSSNGKFTKLKSISNFEIVEELQTKPHVVRKVKINEELSVLKEYPLDDKQDRRAFEKQSFWLARINHRNIIKVKSIFEEHEKNRGYIEFPFYEKGNIKEWAHKKKASPEELQQKFLEILKTFDYLSWCGIIHGDCKTSNILIDHTETPILTDFDRAIIQSTNVSSTSIALLQVTPKYTAPELLKKPPSPPTSKCDIFSFAATILEVVYNITISENQTSSDLIKLIPKPANNNQLEKDLIFFLTAALQNNPNQRPTTQECLRFPFFAKSKIYENQNLKKYKNNNNNSENEGNIVDPIMFKFISSTLAAPPYWKDLSLDPTHFELVDVTNKPIQEEEEIDNLSTQKNKNNNNIFSKKTWKEAIEELMNKQITTFYPYLNKGADSHPQGFKKFEITKVEIIENSSLWKTYSVEKERILNQLCNLKRGIHSIKVFSSEEEWINNFFHLNSTLNEVLLFHAPNQDPIIMSSVLRNGCDARYCNRSMFGGAVYFAENATKSDEYCQILKFDPEEIIKDSKELEKFSQKIIKENEFKLKNQNNNNNNSNEKIWKKKEFFENEKEFEKFKQILVEKCVEKVTSDIISSHPHWRAKTDNNGKYNFDSFPNSQHYRDFQKEVRLKTLNLSDTQEYSILLSRVLLGNFHTCYHPQKDSIKISDSTRLPPRDSKNDNVLFHSVVAECQRTSGKRECRLKNYREFVLYDRNQVYSELKITFKRKN